MICDERLPPLVQAAVVHAQFETCLQDTWRAQLRASSPPRAGVAAWAVVDAIPAHPVLTVAIGVAATGRTKPAVNQAVAQFEAAGVLRSLTTSARNRFWEAAGLLDLIAGLEAGAQPT